MSLRIPRRKIEVEPNEISIQRQYGIYAFPTKIGAFKTEAKIIPKNFVLILEGDKAKSAISMKQEFNNLNYSGSHIKVSKKKLHIPTMKQFMVIYQKANEAVERKAVLYDASGNLIEGQKRESYLYTLNYNCWVWINAGFEKGKGCLGLDLVTVDGLNKDNSLSTTKVPLEDCLTEEGWAEVESMNSQGFPTKKSKIDKYEPGKVVYFYPPVAGCVAWVSANFDRFRVDSYGSRWDRNPHLGVFPCAEGQNT